MLADIKLGHITENSLYSVVKSFLTLLLRNIHSDERLLKNTTKEVLYLDVGITKKGFCCKASSFFGHKISRIKS